MARTVFYQERHTKIGGLLREAVFGFNDGLISTVALIAGLQGAFLSHSIILLAGIAEMFAGAFSMGLGTYLGNKTEYEVYKTELSREKWEVENKPEVEREEIREIYRARGFHGELLEKVTDVITSDKKVWIEVMMQEELGFAKGGLRYSPEKHGVAMGSAFMIGAIIPLLPYLFIKTEQAFFITLIFAAISLLVIGALKTYFTKRPIWKSALETLMIGILASAASYGIGNWIGN